MITEDRLKEIEAAPRDAMIAKAEISELIAAYRLRIDGLRVTRNDGGCWLTFSAQNGAKASISIEVMAAERGPIVAKALLGWANDVDCGGDAFDTPGNRNPTMRYAGYSGQPMPSGLSDDAIAAYNEGVRSRVD